MTASEAAAGGPLRSAHVPDDILVLARLSVRPGTGPGPRFRDDVWDLSPACHVVNAPRGASTIRFDKIGDPVWRLTAKEYAYARLTRLVEGSKRRPPPRTLANEVRTLGHFFTHLDRHRPGMRLNAIADDEILDGSSTSAARARAGWPSPAPSGRGR